MPYFSPKQYILDKLCPKGHMLTEERLYTDKTGRTRCKTCRGLYSKAYLAKHKDRLKVYHKKWDAVNKERRYEVSRRSRLKYTYGITDADFEAMKEDQEDRCAICNKAQQSIRANRFARKTTMNLDVDHDHITGIVRGLLCRKCNAGLGMFQESPELLFKAYSYLTTGPISNKS